MAQKNKKRGGISWELVGIVGLLAVFGIGILVWASGGDSGAIAEPKISSLRPDAAGEPAEAAPVTEGGTVVAVGQDTAPAGIERPSGVDEDGRPYIGKEDAPVTVYEFADFQCPHCKAFTMDDAPVIKADYVDKGVVKLVFVNFPFMGDESNQAARAALCGSEQGKFWDMHDWLFANQAELSNTGGFSRDRLSEIAESAGLDVEAFNACLVDPAIIDRAKADRDFGGQVGVDSTPSFLINEQLLAGPTLLSLREAIDQAAAAKE
jgi:protein-disulfide isomerase